MADLRVPARLPAVQPPARTEAVRAAQRAFFQTAGAAEPAPAPARPEVRDLPEPGAAPPARPLRPGSLLDIKV